MIPLVVDTDTAADDCFALLVALLDPRADLKAVTMVAGNVGFAQQVHNALLTIALAGRAGEVPVHLGADRPLLRDWVDAVDVHGDGVGGIRRPEDGQATSSEHAAQALIRLSHEYEGRLRIVAIGPLTNIALAVRLDSGFAARIDRLTVMGGSINGRGNITPAAEFNIYVDPEAAEITARAGFGDLRFLTWDPVTLRDAVFDQARVDEIAALGTPLSRFFVRANQATFDFDIRAGINGSTHPDSLSVALSLDEDIVLESAPFEVTVETAGHSTRGATVFDWRSSTPNATAPTRIDGDRFFAYLAGILALAPPTPDAVVAAVDALPAAPAER
ncbi:nucleoside hydrolase [Microbacterium sp. cx-55]|uniref:nucleoside hydrolase n=1 Tax=Microbacterium sp. cx-55 TaxID=2875948 RepID=UPI001CBD1A82|nr:nucleoside hydrolase [Microbacterium sp. cx-55]MBZ4488049.1 nucleoside hydrolase [Microbacterium sp. cx-55]UGB34545.1 nucleoside hydrolase [Microbacterium sp. cx-55]